MTSQPGPEEGLTLLPCYQIIVAARLFTMLMNNRLGRHGIAPGQLSVLVALYGQDGLQPSELAQRTFVEAPTMTVHLARMEESGLITRRPHPTDGRRSLVYLTEHAQSLRGVVLAKRAQIDDDIFAEFDEGVREVIHDRLVQIIARAQILVREDLEVEDGDATAPRAQDPAGI